MNDDQTPEHEQDDLEEFAESHRREVLSENEGIARDLRATRASLSATKQELARIQAELATAERVLEESAVLRPNPGWLKPARAKKGTPKRATLVAMLSDIHGGERVEAEEMQDYNKYTLDIAEYRIHRFFEKVIKLGRDYVAGVEFDGIVLALGGDQSSGTIHDELTETNELSPFDTVLWLAPLILSGIEMWAEEFKNVHIVSVPGNHGRDSKIPRYKGRSAHNTDTLLSKIIASFYGRSNPGGTVTFDIPDAFDVDFQVYDFRFSVEHGDNMKFAGTSEIGAFGPVKRGTLRKTQQHQQEGRPMNYNLVGHFHQYIPATSQGVLMNGSLKGYDEYARGWHFSPEPPQQALMVVSPEYGITQNIAVKVSKRSEEGW